MCFDMTKSDEILRKMKGMEMNMFRFSTSVFYFSWSTFKGQVIKSEQTFITFP